MLSDLAKHSQNLQQHPNASVLIIEDESESEQIFARKRVQYKVIAERVEIEAERKKIVENMTELFGEIIGVITQLNDFNLYKLKAQQGLYIEGFGRAFDIKQRNCPKH